MRHAGISFPIIPARLILFPKAERIGRCAALCRTLPIGCFPSETCGTGRDEPRSDAGDRPAIPGGAVLRRASDGVASAKRGSSRERGDQFQSSCITNPASNSFRKHPASTTMGLLFALCRSDLSPKLLRLAKCPWVWLDCLTRPYCPSLLSRPILSVPGFRAPCTACVRCILPAMPEACPGLQQVS